MPLRMQVCLRLSFPCFLSTSDTSALGFVPPDSLKEDRKLRISVTEGDSVYDATIPGGLKVNK